MVTNSGSSGQGSFMHNLVTLCNQADFTATTWFSMHTLYSNQSIGKDIFHSVSKVSQQNVSIFEILGNTNYIFYYFQANFNETKIDILAQCEAESSLRSKSRVQLYIMPCIEAHEGTTTKTTTPLAYSADTASLNDQKPILNKSRIQNLKYTPTLNRSLALLTSA